MATLLIVNLPEVVDVRPLMPAASSVLVRRATPRFVAPVIVGLTAVALELAMPRIPSALLESPAALKARE